MALICTRISIILFGTFVIFTENVLCSVICVIFVLLSLAGGIMVMVESPLEGNSGGQRQIQTLRIFPLLVVVLLEVVK